MDVRLLAPAIIAVLAVFAALVCVFRPRTAWRWRLLGTRWMYAEPDRLEPSDAALVSVRIRGVIALLAFAGTGLYLYSLTR